MGNLESVRIPEVRSLQVDDIPSCSVNDQLILDMVTDDEVELEQLALIIEEHPSLVAMIVGLANSAYFSAPMQIYSVSDAIIKVLGMRMVRSIVLSVVLGRSLDLSKCPEFSAIDYWADSLATARFCQILTINSDFKKLVPIDQVYLSALLCNFGSLVLIHHYPKEMNKILIESEGSLERQLVAQRNILGIDQSEAGVLLGRAWSLPTLAINTMHHCHDPDYEGQDWALCTLVGEVASLVNKAGLGAEELLLTPRCEKVLRCASSECQLEGIQELRGELIAVAQHLQ